ncbi:hypothetical protein [Rhizobium sp. Leaf341]|uniref:hypothetical protein n=1 Tax=Rhizobium sp. Leaf341 TaxID=1736344 RepID=UPI0007146DBD|nr:hypothetical protein [Rhizobium sp. Leaf341]KQR75783.1 hypothetical protein ASG03_19130 [Rhizobium sp. Leaf341]
MNPEQLYVSLQRHIEAVPDFNSGAMTTDAKRWLARTFALVQESGDLTDTARTRTITARLGSEYELTDDVPDLMDILYRAAAVAEVRAPASAQGAFINAGNAFDAMIAVGRVLTAATVSVRIVDPYMDEKALTDFAMLANEGVAIELLADATAVKASLKPASTRFTTQFATTRPLDARLSPSRALHDRLIVIDGTTVWSLTQSLNAIAARSPASIIRVDGDASALKIQAYEAFWHAATPL